MQKKKEEEEGTLSREKCEAMMGLWDDESKRRKGIGRAALRCARVDKTSYLT